MFRIILVIRELILIDRNKLFKRMLSNTILQCKSLSFVTQVIVLSVLTALSSTQQPTQPQGEPIPIIRYENEGVNADGSYQWRYFAKIIHMVSFIFLVLLNEDV